MKKPKGWPRGIPLPTKEEVQEAVRKIGELIVQFEKEDKDKIQGLDGDDLGKIVWLPWNRRGK